MNPSTAQARVVVDELIRGGVRDVVLCPGSRNAPLAFALQDADRAGRIRLHVRIDERTAGLSGDRAGDRRRRAGLRGDDVGHRGGQPGPGRGGGQLRAGAADRAVGQPALRAARHRRQPDHGAAGLLRHPGPRHDQPRAGRGRAGADGRAQRDLAVGHLPGAGRPPPGARSANAGPVHFDIPLREPLVPDRDPGPDPAGPARTANRGPTPRRSASTSRWTST